MNLLEVEQGLTITRAPIEASDAYIELTVDKGQYAIEKPAIVATKLVIDPVSQAIARIANESVVVAPLQDETDTAITGVDRDTVTKFIANETDLQPIGASEEAAPEDKKPESETAVEKKSLDKDILITDQRSKLSIFASATAATAGGLFALHAENAKADTHKIDVGDAIEVSNGIHYLGSATLSEVLATDPTAETTTTDPETTSSAGNIELLKQTCIDAILDGPTIQKPPVMRRAGIRANDPTHYKVQLVSGGFEYPSLSEICPPELNILRLSLGQVWMQRRNNRNSWMQVSGNGYPAWRGNNEGSSGVQFAAYQEAPESVINMCNDKGRFQKVKIVLTDYAKIPKTQTIIEKATHTIPVPVKGSCKEARHSKQVAESLGF